MDSVDNKEEVYQAERDWLQAHRDVDLEALAALMHPDYRIIRPDGPVWGKEQALASYRGGGRHWELAEIDEVDVRVYGEAAVAVGRWRAKGVSGGERFDYTARYVSVWVKEAGVWRMVSDQSTEIG